MAERIWTYLSNPFLVASRNNFEKAITISTFTDARLAATPSLSARYATYHPLHLALLNAFSAWQLGGGQQKTSTGDLKALLKGLTAAVNDWDYEIQAFARRGTPAYATFFPQGHAPFQQGKQDMRIAAVQTLSDALATITPEPAVKTQVDAYLVQLTNANTQQEGRKGGTDALSSAVEAARVAVCNGLYGVLGHLMDIHSANPSLVGSFFDLEAIRSRSQDDFAGSVAAGTIKTIAKRTLEPDDMILLKNTGAVPLTFYMAAEKDAPLLSTDPSVTIPEGQEQTVPASALGDVATDRYLIVRNASALVDGNWAVEI